MKIATIPRFIADVLFPGRCLLCGTWLLLAGEPGESVCADCLRRLKPLAGPRCGICGIPLISEEAVCTRCRVTSFAFARNHSVFAYAAEIKDLVRSYKFSGRVRLSRLFAQFLAEAIRNEFPTASVVPVPPRPGGSSLDPVGRMARMLRKEHGIPVLSPLVRTGGVSQKTLDLEERRKNLLGKIRVKPGFEAPQRTVLLDDIFTTGATADACARALCAAGCREVGVVTLAIEE